MTKAPKYDLEEQIRQNLHTLSNHLTAILVILELIEGNQANGYILSKEDFLNLKEEATNMLKALRSTQQNFEALTGKTN